MEKITKVVFSKDDAKNINEFFTYFGDKVPDELQAHLDKWQANPEAFTLKDQEELTADFCKAMLECDHELKEDEVWEPIENRNEDYWFSAKFDRDLQEHLDAPEETDEEKTE